MYRKLLFLICLFVEANVLAQWNINPSLDELLLLRIPVIDIHTVGEEEPTFTPITHPSGAFGESIISDYVPGRMTIISHNDTLYDSGEYISKTSGLMIKVRGNTSAYNPIIPYKLKLQRKADLLFRGNDVQYADKEWIIIDGNSINTIVGYQLSNLIGMEWTPAYSFVNVRINDQYRGIYILIESVKRNTNCRLNVDESGYIFEHDAYWWKEDYYISTLSDRKYTIKYPKYSEATIEELDYLTDVVNNMEQSFQDDNYESVVDVTSFARWILAHDILGSGDAAGTNIYLTKYDNTVESLIKMPLLWDFGAIMSKNDTWSAAHMHYTFFPSLFSSNNKVFTETYISLWEQQHDYIFRLMKSYLQDLRLSTLIADLEQSRIQTKQLYGFDDCTWDEDIQVCLNWFTNREGWLTSSIKTMSEQQTAIGNIYNNRVNDKTDLYDLSGKKIIGTKKGIVVSHKGLFLNK